MAEARPSIKMGINMMAFSKTDSDQGMVHMNLTVTLDIRVNGKTISSMVTESCFVMANSSFKVDFKMGLNTVQESINTKMVIFFKEFSSKTRSEGMAVIISLREGF